ncbi:Carboxypeptidase B [Amphibalanus amphitrite]|uniref:Carboxypeptidase B n=1 Tax=Amphibalanus amphitrite TaxID=1232801 RepID=A0A6A4V894_AMPAM|nr:Carboxypeptidase B [Amphibalanus amphitrite]
MTMTTELSDTNGEEGDFSGYQVLRVLVIRRDTVEILRSYQDRPGVDFWTELSDRAGPVDVMVSPDVGRQLKEELTRSRSSYVVNIEDVQVREVAVETEVVNAEHPTAPHADIGLTARSAFSLTWRKYHRLADHHQYLDFVADSYSRLCQTFSIGRSSEGRDIKGIKCGKGKREIWIDGGIHGREWISPAVVSYLIREFSERAHLHEHILGNFTIYSVPVLNPDGYEFTYTGGKKNRFWRKTRSKNRNSKCIGVDANRNFDIYWGKVGVSRDPCSDIYAGPRPFSEPETRAVRRFILSHAGKLEMFLTFHSYSQLLLLPFGYSEERPPDYSQLLRVAKLGRQRIFSASGTWFKIGQPSQRLYPVSGISQDWAKARAGVQYSYSLELRDRGKYGLLLPASQIEPSGKEMVEGVTAMIEEIL